MQKHHGKELTKSPIVLQPSPAAKQSSHLVDSDRATYQHQSPFKFHTVDEQWQINACSTLQNKKSKRTHYNKSSLLTGAVHSCHEIMKHYSSVPLQSQHCTENRISLNKRTGHYLTVLHNHRHDR